MARARAYGSDATLKGAFEAAYGTPPADDYRMLSFRSSTLGATKPLGVDPLLGHGRDARDPYYEPLSVSGDVEVPIDLRGFVFWLKALFGVPVTTASAAGSDIDGDGDTDADDRGHTHVFTSGGRTAQPRA